MIIWSGYGFLVAVIIFVDSLIAELITRTVTGKEDVYGQNQLPLGCSFLVSALIIWGLSGYFNNKKEDNKGTYVFDRVTIARGNHRLFFIPFSQWAYITAALGVIIIVFQFLK